MYYIKLNTLERSSRSLYFFEAIKYRQTRLNVLSYEIFYIY